MKKYEDSKVGKILGMCAVWSLIIYIVLIPICSVLGLVGKFFSPLKYFWIGDEPPFILDISVKILVILFSLFFIVWWVYDHIRNIYYKRQNKQRLQR